MGYEKWREKRVREGKQTFRERDRSTLAISMDQEIERGREWEREKERGMLSEVNCNLLAYQYLLIN